MAFHNSVAPSYCISQNGNSIYVRYADDIVAGFEHEIDAVQFLAEVRERLERIALSLHPDKMRLIEFGRDATDVRRKRGLVSNRPEITS